MPEENIYLFCGSKLWDSNLTWYTEAPDLTHCFEQTVLIWISTCFLWLLLPVDLYYTLNSKYKTIPWSWKNVLKLVSNGLLIVLCTFDFIYILSKNSDGATVNNVDIFTPLIKFLSWILCFILVLFHMRMGKMSSALLWGYWFLVSILGIPQIRTDLNAFINNETDLHAIKVTYVISYCLWLVMLLLNFFADNIPRYSSIPPVERPCPERMCSFPSRLFYTWLDKLILSKRKKPLDDSDLYNLNYTELTHVVSKQFEQEWTKYKDRQSEFRTDSASFMNNDNDDVGVKIINGKIQKETINIVLPLIKAFGGTFLLGSLFKFIQSLLCFVNPLILSFLIDFIESNEESWKGYFYCIILCINSTLQSLLLTHHYDKMSLTGLHIRTSLMSAIYKKSLRISNSAKKEIAAGEIVNLMTVDCQRFMTLVNHLNGIWSIPFQIAVSILLLWQFLGRSVLCGLAVLVAVIPINFLIAHIVKSLQTHHMDYKDKRVKIMTEILSGIRVLKLYAWEPYFEEMIMKIRNKESRVLKHINYSLSSIPISWIMTPFLFGLVTFTTYVYIDDNNVLDAKVAFVSFALMNILRFPLCYLPVMLMDTIQAWVSVKRINKFLNLEELDPDSINHDFKEVDPVIMEDCTLSWDKESSIILKNINLRIKDKNLVAVVGGVGSGKSSLLAALLGEMEKLSGRINITGSVAYVPQQAWIQNTSLKNNIVFGKPQNDKLYRKVIDCCALRQDLDMLPARDKTQIGEKGINLSGGQKQRISLARAVYNDCDIYLLDDPLSSVDSLVGKHVFKDVIGPEGMLQYKTRILVTHGISHLSSVDLIVVLKDGIISEVGTYKELRDSKGAFNDFIMTHLQQETQASVEDLDDFNELFGSDRELNELISQHLGRKKSVDTNDSVFKSIESVETESYRIQVLPSSDSLDYDGLKTENKKEPVLLQSTQPDTQEISDNNIIDEDTVEIGEIKWDVYKLYMSSMGLLSCILTIVFHLLFQIVGIFGNIWLTIWSNDPVVTESGNRDYELMNDYIIVYAISGFSLGILGCISDVAPVLGCWLAGVKVHNNLLHAILHVPQSFFDTTPSGRILTRFSKDLDILETYIPRNVSDLIWSSSLVLGTFFIISYSTPLFMTTVVPIAVIYYFMRKYYVSSSRQLNRLESMSRAPIYNHFGESSAGAVSIRAYDVEDRFISEFEEKIDKNISYYFISLKENRWLQIRLDMLGNIIIFFAALFAVRARGWISAALAGLSISQSFQITEMFNVLVRLSTDLEVNIVAVERIKQFVDLDQEGSWEIDSYPLNSSWPDRGEIQFNDFSMKYRSVLDNVLHGISFVVKPGEKIGVVGRTGAGKSSLTLSLFRIIEAAEGSILIDGVDISKIGLHTLRSRLTIIPQDPVLFSGSLRLNVDPYEKHTDEQVWKALELSHLKHFVSGFSSGLQFQISEGGDNLSVGQKQLICLARALLRKTKVLILDEATASVDLETDDLIQKTIRSEFAECTVLTIAHRINTIMDSDRVVVLDKGHMVEYDSPENLLRNRKSIFYSLAKESGGAHNLTNDLTEDSYLWWSLQNEH